MGASAQAQTCVRVNGFSRFFSCSVFVPFLLHVNSSDAIFFSRDAILEAAANKPQKENEVGFQTFAVCLSRFQCEFLKIVCTSKQNQVDFQCVPSTLIGSSFVLMIANVIFY